MIVITHVDNGNMPQIMIINIILMPCNFAARNVFRGMGRADNVLMMILCITAIFLSHDLILAEARDVY